MCLPRINREKVKFYAHAINIFGIFPVLRIDPNDLLRFITMSKLGGVHKQALNRSPEQKHLSLALNRLKTILGHNLKKL